MEADYSFIKHLFCEKSIFYEVYDIRNLFKVDRPVDRPTYSIRRLFNEEENKSYKVKDERFYLDKLFESRDEKVCRTLDLRLLFKEDIKTPDVTYDLTPLFEARKQSSQSERRTILS